MDVPFLDISDQDAILREEIKGALSNVISETAFSSGAFVDKFEDEFAAFCGAKYCIAVNSGTSALHLALLSKGVASGDEVLTVPNTFPSCTKNTTGAPLTVLVDAFGPSSFFVIAATASFWQPVSVLFDSFEALSPFLCSPSRHSQHSRVMSSRGSVVIENGR